MKSRSVALATAVLGALAALGGGLVLARISVRLTNPAEYQYDHRLPAAEAGLPSDPAAYGLPFEEVAFPTADGATLRGWLVPGQPSGVHAGIVAVHGRASNRRAYLDRLPLFHDLGLTVLLFDLRENGASDGDGRGTSLGYREAEDVSAAAQFLKRQAGLDRVAVIGQSLGASSAILAAAHDPTIDAVISESAIASFREYLYDWAEQLIGRNRVLKSLPIPPRPTWWPVPVVEFTALRREIPHVTAAIEVIDQIAPRPILLLHGTADDAVRWEQSQELFDRARAPKELWLADQGTHTQVYGDSLDEYRRRVTAFLQRALLA